jgi:serine/threonine-protein kinase
MLGSRWILGGLLGMSDACEIYEAEATSERRFAALKLFARDLGSEPAWSEHVALTRALSELPGDGLARAYDFGLEPSTQRPYVASERITFPTVARYVSTRGPLPLRVVAQALTTLAAALDAAHAAGIVHGGLKPQNVFVSFDNPRWARLTDFGVARLRHRAGHGPESLLGWSAPEGSATPAADRYALALVCFFGATGSAWYSALRGGEAASEHGRPRVASERAASQGAELDPLFDAWFARALHAEPSKRFGTAAEMASAFVDVFTGAPTAEMPARASLPPPSQTTPLAAVAASGLQAAGPARPLAATLSMAEVPSAGSNRPSSPPDATIRLSTPVPASDAVEVSYGSLPPASTPSEPPARRSSSFPPGSASVSPRSASAPPGATSSFPPRNLASAPPRPNSSMPPRTASSGPPLAKSGVPRWFWLACSAMALVAVLAVWWLSRY